MVDRATFGRIKQNHGTYASWPVWANATARAKSNIGDMRVLDPERNPALLQILRNDVIMLRLNVSGRKLAEPFRNFHDPSPMGQDFKIRCAFAGTPYYGAYMTDFIKRVEMVKSADLMRYLKENPSAVGANIEMFFAEMNDLQCDRPTLLTFGEKAHRLVANHIPRDKYSRLIPIMHYSHRISQEAYRQGVLKQLSSTS